MTPLPLPIRLTIFVIVGAEAGFIASLQAAKTWLSVGFSFQVLIIGGPIGVLMGVGLSAAIFVAVHAILGGPRARSRTAAAVAILLAVLVSAGSWRVPHVDEWDLPLQLSLAFLGLLGSSIEVAFTRAESRRADVRHPPRGRP